MQYVLGGHCFDRFSHYNSKCHGLYFVDPFVAVFSSSYWKIDLMNATKYHLLFWSISDDSDETFFFFWFLTGWWHIFFCLCNLLLNLSRHWDNFCCFITDGWITSDNLVSPFPYYTFRLSYHYQFILYSPHFCLFADNLIQIHRGSNWK